MKKCFLMMCWIVFLPLVVKSQIRRVGDHLYNYSNNNVNLFPDSIRIDFPEDKTFVVFEARDYVKDHVFIDNFNSALSDLIATIKKSSADSHFTITPHQATVVIKEEGEQEIRITTLPALVTKMSVKDNQVTELLPPGWEITIIGKNSKTYIYGKDLESISGITRFNFKIVSDRIDSQLTGHMGKKTVIARMIVRNDRIENGDVTFKYPGNFLVFLPSVGVGFISSNPVSSVKFYPDLGVGVAAVLQGRSGKKSQMIKLNVNYLLNMGTLVSLSYGLNIAEKGNPRWLALGAGAVKAIGDFPGDKIRFFLSYDIKNNLSISPEFYTSMSIRGVFGLRVNYTLPGR